jgi:hypothetical protein
MVCGRGLNTCAASLASRPSTVSAVVDSTVSAVVDSTLIGFTSVFEVDSSVLSSGVVGFDSVPQGWVLVSTGVNTVSHRGEVVITRVLAGRGCVRERRMHGSRWGGLGSGGEQRQRCIDTAAPTLPSRPWRGAWPCRKKRNKKKQMKNVESEL